MTAQVKVRTFITVDGAEQEIGDDVLRGRLRLGANIARDPLRPTPGHGGELRLNNGSDKWTAGRSEAYTPLVLVRPIPLRVQVDHEGGSVNVLSGLLSIGGTDSRAARGRVASRFSEALARDDISITIPANANLGALAALLGDALGVSVTLTASAQERELGLTAGTYRQGAGRWIRDLQDALPSLAWEDGTGLRVRTLSDVAASASVAAVYDSASVYIDGERTDSGPDASRIINEYIIADSQGRTDTYPEPGSVREWGRREFVSGFSLWTALPGESFFEAGLDAFGFAPIVGRIAFPLLQADNAHIVSVLGIEPGQTISVILKGRSLSRMYVFAKELEWEPGKIPYLTVIGLITNYNPTPFIVGSGMSPVASRAGSSSVVGVSGAFEYVEWWWLPAASRPSALQDAVSYLRPAASAVQSTVRLIAGGIDEPTGVPPAREEGLFLLEEFNGQVANPIRALLAGAPGSGDLEVSNGDGTFTPLPVGVDGVPVVGGARPSYAPLKRAGMPTGVLLHRGDWSAAAAYEPNDVVTDGGVDWRRSGAPVTGGTSPSGGGSGWSTL